ncbi:CHD3-type chromatin-remodeling factor PICKLE [Selaginella moellendorffii]|uniref:CHD3-type chromatin-remodeling factor PICKLE n=1 Tax=Selaginella moellendorffii TaxID=88036 RepID=UPI000D1CF9BC|nr:CHD3-type chromatin-remodeling factor PICKLE [Selaginella moellendorffii]|eukprot:XP_024544547.1 CHD3-type chromatin-remodeling factor PICKLE [Selaginella moellendorffii]
MAEGLRVRAKRKASYFEDSSDEDDYEDSREMELDGAGEDSDLEEAVSSKSEDFCTICKSGGKVLCCDACTAVYHLQCLDPPMKSVPKGSWRCPKCEEPLADIEKILDSQMRPLKATEKEDEEGKKEEEEELMKHYLVKWKSRSYLHCSWIPLNEMERASRMYPGLRMKMNHFHKTCEAMKELADEDQGPIRVEWITVDRVIDERETENTKEYLVKWKELGYDEATWEVKEDIAQFQSQIDYYEKIAKRGPRKTKRTAARHQKTFTQFETTPDFLSDGVLHPYQLEGLNFLRFAWQQEKHVILADEMGLGKTIQTIAFLASLKQEEVTDPHLVVAPLSTLRNWEREFATWAPDIHIVVYAGNAKARSVIREFEFFYPKTDKTKKKYYSERKHSKQDRIKFDVLLTSYEMITFDAAILKSIKWECLIVDEGHRLKSKESKLFQTLQNYTTYHRVLLTGTPLQNNLDELFTLMHFLDASKFSSLEEFQQEFRDINQEEQVSRLHKMLASHLLRRVKKDVLKQLPPKKELMLRVELSSVQKELYKEILTRNYEALSKRGGPQVSLNNVVMELRKLCGHPYMVIEPDSKNEEEENRHRIESSGKLSLLDKMMVKLKASGHRVLLYSQFQHMLDILEDYLTHKNWSYERIDGNVTGAERQIRIDRFNAPNSNRFCFLLSTRAGGLGINLATADTVVIYDSDWNPHADLQAMARAHRLGQKNMVMIYRLVTRGSIEERMMQMTKKKMVLEHLVVGRMKTQVLNQEELDDILRYGAKSVFGDENDDSGKSWQIHYDDSAIDRLLDRSDVETGHEMSTDEDDNDLLKAFKVANFEYVNHGKGRKEEAFRESEADYEAEHLSSTERLKYWESLLKERFEKKHVQEQEMGKGKRSRKQVVHGEDDLAGMDYSSSENDENDELDTEYIQSVEEKTKKQKGESSVHPAPLMEGDGKSLKVLGFRRKHRVRFVQILMRFGLGDFTWSSFVPYFKQKQLHEIKEYGTLFLTHIAEDVTDSDTFADGVPKEGLRIQDVLVRVAVLHLITNKVKQYTQNPKARLFSYAVYAKFPALKGTTVWTEEHDKYLLDAIIKHGYGKWLEIVEDARLQSAVREELKLPPIGSFSSPKAQDTVVNGHAPENDNHLTDAEAFFNRRIIEFLKKRVALMEKVLNAEYHLDDQDIPANRSNGGVEPGEGPKTSYQKPQPTFVPYPTPLTPEEVLGTALDNDPKRLKVPAYYNELCSMISENRLDAFQTYAGNKSAGIRLRRCIRQIDVLCSEMRRGLGVKGEEAMVDGAHDRDDVSDNEGIHVVIDD